jgi:hypothetical protein
MDRESFREWVSEFWEDYWVILCMSGLLILGLAYSVWRSRNHPLSPAELDAFTKAILASGGGAHQSKWLGPGYFAVMVAVLVLLLVGIKWLGGSAYGWGGLYWRNPVSMVDGLSPAAWRLVAAQKRGRLLHSRLDRRPHLYGDLLSKRLGPEPERGPETKQVGVALFPRRFRPLHGWGVWALTVTREVDQVPFGKGLVRSQTSLTYEIAIFGRFERFRDAWRFRKLVDGGMVPFDAFQAADRR